MRKIFVIIILTATLLGLLSGCGKGAKEESTPTTTSPGSGLTVDDIFNSLRSSLAPVSNQFRMGPLDKTKLEDRTSWSGEVTDTITGNKYDISVSCTHAGDVEFIILHALKGTRTELNFALISYYLYKSTGLREMDADAFYEQFKLLTTEPKGELTENDWWINVHHSAGLLSFIAVFG